MIKPIETKYKGYRFRSRLEARWAVFFDALGLQWEYEKEGYDLGAAGWYLPDFWVPYPPDVHEWFGEGFWVEIKAQSLSEEEQAKCLALASSSIADVFAISGNPWPGQLSVTSFSSEGISPNLQSSCFWKEHTSGCQFKFCAQSGGCIEMGMDHVWGQFSPDNIVSHAMMQQAFTAARSARFEHGENSG